jgi:hypothetical protein
VKKLPAVLAIGDIPDLAATVNARTPPILFNVRDRVPLKTSPTSSGNSSSLTLATTNKNVIGGGSYAHFALKPSLFLEIRTLACQGRT